MKKPFFLVISFSVFFSFTPFSKWKGYKKLQLPEYFSLVPSGKLLDDATKNTTVAIESFFISSQEVSNLQYREFLADLNNSAQPELLSEVTVKASNWENPAFEKTYHQHPSYDNYPVVNVSHKAAQRYCQWLEAKLQAVNEDRYDVSVMLPTREQWIYAANGGQQQVTYPWGTSSIRNEKGLLLANFRRLGDESIRRNKITGELEVTEMYRGDLRTAGSLNDNAHMPAPSNSYMPNDFGLYHMAGNVAEMLDQPGQTKGGSWNSTGYDIRIDAEGEHAGWTEPSPFIGFRPIVIVKKK